MDDKKTVYSYVYKVSNVDSCKYDSMSYEEIYQDMIKWFFYHGFAIMDTHNTTLNQVIGILKKHGIDFYTYTNDGFNLLHILCVSSHVGDFPPPTKKDIYSFVDSISKMDDRIWKKMRSYYSYVNYDYIFFNAICYYGVYFDTHCINTLVKSKRLKYLFNHYPQLTDRQTVAPTGVILSLFHNLEIKKVNKKHLMFVLCNLFCDTKIPIKEIYRYICLMIESCKNNGLKIKFSDFLFIHSTPNIQKYSSIELINLIKKLLDITTGVSRKRDIANFIELVSYFNLRNSDEFDKNYCTEIVNYFIEKVTGEPPKLSYEEIKNIVEENKNNKKFFIKEKIFGAADSKRFSEPLENFV